MPAEDVFRRTLGLDAAGMDAEYARFLDSRNQGDCLASDFPEATTAPEGNAVSETDKKELAQVLQKDPEDFFANLKWDAAAQGRGKSEASLPKRRPTAVPPVCGTGKSLPAFGKMYLESNREEEALAEYVTWILRDGDSREPLLKAAEIYTNRKDWASVARMLELSVYIHPYDQEVQKQLGEAAMKRAGGPCNRCLSDVDGSQYAQIRRKRISISPRLYWRPATGGRQSGKYCVLSKSRPPSKRLRNCFWR